MGFSFLGNYLLPLQHTINRLHLIHVSTPIGRFKFETGLPMSLFGQIYNKPLNQVKERYSLSEKE